MGMICFIPVEIMLALQWYDIELKSILKNPTDFNRTINYPIKGCQLNQYNKNAKQSMKVLQKDKKKNNKKANKHHNMFKREYYRLKIAV